MSAMERVCRWSMLVAWLWASFVSTAIARPEYAALALRSPVSMAPTFANVSTSLSPEPVNGNCEKCGIEAPGGIRLVYWEPDSAVVNSRNITLAQDYAQIYTQVQDDFTYTSPSVYVIYSSLRATATCSDSALHTVGPSFAEKTIAYSSRFLAYGTLSMPDAGCSEHVVVDGFHTIDFSSLYYNPITTTTTFKAGCAPYVNPRLSLPAQLTNVDPAWQDCEPLFYGAFDPPSILRKVSGGLVPSPVGAGLTTDPVTPEAVLDSNPAQPIVTPAPTIATQTDGFRGNDAQPSQVGNAPVEDLPVEDLPGGGTRPLTIVDLGPSDPAQHSILAENDKMPQGDSRLAVPTASAVLPAGDPVPAAGKQVSYLTALASNSNNAPADVFVPAEPGHKGAAGESSPSGYSMVHLSAGAFVAVPDASGNPSSIAVPSGDYLIPQPTTNSDSNAPQQALTLQGGAVTTVPMIPSPSAVTLQNGQVTIIPADAPPQAVTLQGGIISSISPTARTTLTLLNGQMTAVPIASTSSSNGGSAPAIPQQILTLKGGKVTTIPIDLLSQTITLQGGKLTTIPNNGPPQTVTLANGQVSTLSAVLHTSVTLADGEVTSIPISNPAFIREEGESFLVPDATISGKVHYTNLPIVMIEHTGLNISGNGTNVTVSGTEVQDLVSAAGTASSTNNGAAQGAVAKPTGSIMQGGALASGRKTSDGERLVYVSGWLFGLAGLAHV